MRRLKFLLLLATCAALLPLALPAAGLTPAVAGENLATGAAASAAAAFTGTASGQVFDPNPVVTLQDETLTDQHDQDFPVLQPAYRTVTLTHLDGSSHLNGDFATIDPKQKTPAFSPTGQFIYPRSDDRFEQVMAYYHVTAAQLYIQSLGFTNINNEPQNLLLNPIGQDNSYYDPRTDIITFGKGGVDDAEDAEMIWHEYGHAIQDSQVPGYGTTNQSDSIGEGFGDYWAFTMSQADSPDTATTPLACIADWDSTAYTYNQLPHCLRRVDTNMTMADYQRNGDVHLNGEIWSRALHDINLALGRDTANTVILQAQFAFSPSTTFQAAAQATVNTASALYGSAVASQVQAAFAARGIL